MSQKEIDEYLYILDKSIDNAEYSIIVSNIYIELQVDILSTILNHITNNFSFIKKKVVEKLTKKIHNLLMAVYDENPDILFHINMITSSSCVIDSNSKNSHSEILLFNKIKTYFDNTLRFLELNYSKYENLQIHIAN